MAGVPFLDKVAEFAAVYPNARLIVEWAPGAPPPVFGEDESSWTWVDITSDVLQASGRGINISPMGRSDWSSRANTAGCGFTLDNTSGNYSQGPQSAYYPNVKVNIPVKVSVTLTGLDADKVIRFQGYTYSLKPTWDVTGRQAFVDVEAAGLMRRLQLRTTPLQSPMRRAFSKTFDTTAVAYWPMEEDDDATQFTSALPGKPPMQFTNMSLSSYSGIAGSEPVPTFDANSTYSGLVSRTFTTGCQVDFHTNKDSAPAGATAIMRIHMKNSTAVGRWEIVMSAGSTNAATVNGYAADSSLAVNDTGAYITTVGNGPVHWSFSIKQNGANVDWQLTTFPTLGGNGATHSGSVAGTRGNIFKIDMLADADNAGLSMGHIIVYDDFDYTQEGDPAFGYVGDTAEDRIVRLSEEENLPLDYIPTGNDEIYTFLGIQSTTNYLDLVREAADADLGIVYDGLGPGITYRDRQNRYNRSAALTLNPSHSDIQPSFEPTDDDQQTINQSTVSRTGGSSTTYEDVDGVLGTATIGNYLDTRTLNVRYDSQTETIAQWFVHLGTVEGYRYPQLNIDLRTIPNKALNWLSCFPNSRVDITNITDYVTQHPNGDIITLLEGWSERLGRFEWQATLNLSPGEPWKIARLASPTSDTNQFIGRLESGFSTLNSSASAGATSLSVATTTGKPLWTRDSDDFPFYVVVGGWRIRVTNITGSSSPQTFTVDAIPAAISSGAEVTVWQPNVLAL